MPAPAHPVIVLMTDFGITDSYVGQMKGVILSIAPEARIIDLTHAITPQNIAHGAFILTKSADFFPEGSIFISVVDPGVGTSRNAIAVRTEGALFLAPDNGLLTSILQTRSVTEAVTITDSRYLLPVRSSTFHGRDVFSPAAAHLASGVPIQNLGKSIDPATCTRIPMPECHTLDNGKTWEGSIIYTDHFGNLVTSLDARLLDRSKKWHVHAGKHRHPVSRTYGDAADQKPLAYTGSFGTIEIAVRNGNARETLGLKDGDPVRVESTPVAPEKP
ncbi:MAG: SAM-dependent chlorinase/fluorinase [Chlorobiaceae bacterium]|nr:SAM-dependent chlorinase/fluorinase [Chlorobiaceae bacterium]